MTIEIYIPEFFKLSEELEKRVANIDSRIKKIPELNISYPDIKIKPASDYSYDLLYKLRLEHVKKTGKKIDKYYNNVYKNICKKEGSRLGSEKNCVALVTLLIPDVVYFISPPRTLPKGQILDVLTHEIVHTRTFTAGILKRLSLQHTKETLEKNFVLTSLNEGLADYFTIPNDNKDIVKTLDLIGYNILRISPLKQLEKEVEEIKTSHIVSHLPQTNNYYYGLIFMHAVSKYLTESHAISLAFNPLRQGINPGEIQACALKSNNIKDEDFYFRVNSEEIKNPEKYIKKIKEKK